MQAPITYPSTCGAGSWPFDTHCCHTATASYKASCARPG